MSRPRQDQDQSQKSRNLVLCITSYNHGRKCEKFAQNCVKKICHLDSFFMKRKDPLQLFKFCFSKLSCICNFFLSLQGVPILSVNIFWCDRGPLRDQLLPFAATIRLWLQKIEKKYYLLDKDNEKVPLSLSR